MVNLLLNHTPMPPRASPSRPLDRQQPSHQTRTVQWHRKSSPFSSLREAHSQGHEGQVVPLRQFGDKHGLLVMQQEHSRRPHISSSIFVSVWGSPVGSILALGRFLMARTKQTMRRPADAVKKEEEEDDDEKESEVEQATPVEVLRDALRSHQWSSALLFATGGSFSALPAVPGFRFKGIPFSLPLTEETAASLTEFMTAPFGKASDCTFANPMFEGAITALTRHAALELGVLQNCTAVPHKLFLCRPGQCLELLDDEKVGCKFGTLLIEFPSACKGGCLSISHGDSTGRFFGNAENREFVPRFAAFFSECSCEMSKIVAGHCLIVSYSLCVRNETRVPSLAVAASEILGFGTLLSSVLATVPFLLYPTENEYEEHGSRPSVEGLKGMDARVVREIVKAVKGLELYWGDIEHLIKEIGALDYWHGQEWEIDEVSTEIEDISPLWPRNVGPVPPISESGNRVLEALSVGPVWPDWDDCEPDSDDEEYLGDDRLTRRRRFKKSVIIIMSAHSRFWMLSEAQQLRVCLEAPPDSWQKKCAKQVLSRASKSLSSLHVQLSTQVQSLEEFCNLLQGKSLKHCALPVLQTAFDHFKKDMTESKLTQLFSCTPDAFRLLPLFSKQQHSVFAGPCVAALLRLELDPLLKPWQKREDSRPALWLDCLRVLESCKLNDEAAIVAKALAQVVAVSVFEQVLKVISSAKWKQECATALVAKLTTGQNRPDCITVVRLLAQHHLEGVEPLLLHLANTVYSWDAAMECMALGLELRVSFGPRLVEMCIKACSGGGGNVIEDVAKLLELIHNLEQPNCSHGHCEAVLSRQQRNMPALASKELVAACPGMLKIVLSETARLEKVLSAKTNELSPPKFKGPFAAQILAFYIDNNNEISMASLPKARKAAKEINAIPGIRQYLTAVEGGHGTSAHVRLKPSPAMQCHRDRRAHLSELRVLKEVVDFSKSKRHKK